MLIPKKNIILIIYFIMSLYLTYCISNNCIDNCIKYYTKCETKINLIEQCNLACQNGHLTHYMKNC